MQEFITPEPFDVQGDPYRAQVRFSEGRSDARIRITSGQEPFVFDPSDEFLTANQFPPHLLSLYVRTGRAAVLHVLHVARGVEDADGPVLPVDPVAVRTMAESLITSLDGNDNGTDW